MVALALALAACGGPTDAPPVPVEEGFYGAAAGDEPRAVLVARDALVAGGNAVDAAVAYYFAASVTYPAAVSLGAGGVCVVYDVRTNGAEALEFLAPVAAERVAGRRAVAVPALPRGLYALHSRHGRLRFGQLVAPAEAMARFGHRVSRALAFDIGVAGDALLAEPALAKAFDGLAEGDTFVQLDLAATLTQIRTRGVGEFYTGALARRLVDGARTAETDLTAEALVAYAPVWRPVSSLEIGFAEGHAAPPPDTAGVSAFAALVMARGAARGGDRAHLRIETSLRALADRSGWNADGGASALDPDHLARLMADYRADRATDPATLPTPPRAMRENPSGAGFAAVDRDGSAVACAVTLNNLFGSARFAQGTGVLLAAARGPGAASLVPIVVANHHSREVLFAGSATGGIAAPAVMAQVLAGVLDDGATLAEAIAEPRVLHFGNPNVVVPEPGLPEAVRDGLAERGHDLTEPYELGRVNAIHCAEGLRNRPDTCAAVTDRRGYGLAVGG